MNTETPTKMIVRCSYKNCKMDTVQTIKYNSDGSYRQRKWFCSYHTDTIYDNDRDSFDRFLSWYKENSEYYCNMFSHHSAEYLYAKINGKIPNQEKEIPCEGVFGGKYCILTPFAESEKIENTKSTGF